MPRTPEKILSKILQMMALGMEGNTLGCEVLHGKKWQNLLWGHKRKRDKSNIT